MPTLILIMTAVMAAGGSYLTIRPLDAGTQLIISLWSMLWWGAFAFQASRFVVLSGGTEFVYQSTSLFYLGVASALVMLLFGVQAASELFRADTGATEEMV